MCWRLLKLSCEQECLTVRQVSADSAERKGREGGSPEEDWHSIYTEDWLVLKRKKETVITKKVKCTIFSHLDNGYPLQSSSSLRT